MANGASGLVEVLRAHYNKGFPTIDALYSELASAEANAALVDAGEVGPEGPAGGGYVPSSHPAEGPGEPPAGASEQ